jgi:nucleoside recognition membrane protein YjiH
VPKNSRPLPEIETALTELMRRQTRAIVSLLLRIVGVGILIAVGVTQSPTLAANRWILDVIGIALVILPFMTDWGRAMAWRIGLGKAYLGANLLPEAERTLLPLSRPYARFFDATGEGRRLLLETQTRLEAGIIESERKP